MRKYRARSYRVYEGVQDVDPDDLPEEVVKRFINHVSSGVLLSSALMTARQQLSPDVFFDLQEYLGDALVDEWKRRTENRRDEALAPTTP